MTHRNLIPCALLALSSMTPQFTLGVQEDSSAAPFERECAILDAVATGLASTRSWLSNEPEAAIDLIRSQASLVRYAEEAQMRYAETPPPTCQFGSKIPNRLAALEGGVRDSRAALERFVDKTPKEIRTELERHAGAMDRYEAAKTPRPSTLGYVPDAMVQTRIKIDLLGAMGADVDEFERLHTALESRLRDLRRGMNTVERARSARAPRDAYRGDDRAEIEAVVLEHLDGPASLRVLLPESRWARTFGATWNEADDMPEILEVERMTAWAVTEVEDGVLRLTRCASSVCTSVPMGSSSGTTDPARST